MKNVSWCLKEVQIANIDAVYQRPQDEKEHKQGASREIKKKQSHHVPQI